MLTKLETLIRNKDFVITAEIVPPLSGSPAALLREASLLRDSVDAINVTDAAAGRTTMASFASSAILAREGFEPILQVTCRDRNRIALAGDLLGAAAQGVHNLLLLRGDDPRGGDQPEAKAVYDLESADLMKMAREMRDLGQLPSGRKIDDPPHFFIGGADIPRVPDEKWDSKSVLRKIEAGAGFMQTQFCFDLEVARQYAGRLVEDGVTERVGLILGVGPIRSARSAVWMNENLFGVHVPDAIIARLGGATDAAAKGRRICAELITGFREIPGVAGAHVMAPAQGPDAIAQVLASL
jgi:methylenetetrahydrofolate reductase (NADPH)